MPRQGKFFWSFCSLTTVRSLRATTIIGMTTYRLTSSLRAYTIDRHQASAGARQSASGSANRAETERPKRQGVRVERGYGAEGNVKGQNRGGIDAGSSGKSRHHVYVADPVATILGIGQRFVQIRGQFDLALGQGQRGAPWKLSTVEQSPRHIAGRLLQQGKPAVRGLAFGQSR